MLNFKKIAAAISAIALSVTTFVVPTVSAAEASGVTASLSSGKTAVVSLPVACTTYISLNLDGITTDYEGTTNFTNGGNILIKATKGIFKGAAAKTTDFEGLLTLPNFSAPTWTINFNNENADYDLISVAYTTTGAAGLLYGAGTRAVEIALTYTSATAKGDAELEVLDSDFTPLAAITMCDNNGTTTKPSATYASSGVKYSLASGTNVITEVEEEPPVDDNTVAFEGFTGTKENGEADGSVSVATKKTFSGAAGANKILWTVNLKEGGKGTYESTVNLDGEADYTLGMIINGLAKELVASIEAVLAQ